MDPQKPSSGIISMFPIVILFVLFYFLLIKPQQKKAKEQKDMVDKLSVGDNVVLYSGIIVEVSEIPSNKDYIFVKLGDKNIVRVFKSAILNIYKGDNIDSSVNTSNKKKK